MQITCDIEVVGWGTTGIFAVSESDMPFNPIIMITQTDGVFSITSSLTHFTLNPSSELAADSASLVVDFTPISISYRYWSIYVWGGGWKFLISRSK